MALTGRVGLLMLCGIGAVILHPAFSTAWWWLLVVTVLVLADYALAPSPARLRIHREQLPSTRLAQRTSTTLTVHNESRRRMKGALRDAWQPTAGAIGNRHRLDLAAGESTNVTSQLLPSRRGQLRADRITVRSRGPLGLAMRQQAQRVGGDLQVLPAFGSRKHLPSRLARLRELDGRSAVQIRGAGTEFDSLREYVRGDDVRSIDWRATARQRNVVVRTWRPERDRRVVIVIDSGRLSASRVDDVPRLDASMDAALLLASLASKAGDRVDFVIGDRTARVQIRGRHDADPVLAIQDAMSRVEPMLTETSWSALAGAVSGLGRHRALVVLLTTLDPHAIDHGLLPLLQPLTARHRVLLASVQDPSLVAAAAAREDDEQIYTAAAAEQALAQQSRTGRMLGALGVDVLDASAERMAPALADRYLHLKAAGLL